MIKQLIIKARQKPKATRERIAFGIAGVCTALIFAVWAYHLPARNAALLEQRNISEENSVFSEFFTDIKDQVATAKETVDTLASSSEAEIAASSSTQIEPLILDEANIEALNQRIETDTYSQSQPDTNTTTDERTAYIQTIPAASSTASSTQ